MAEFDQLCMNCMAPMNGKSVCPVCGHSAEEPQSVNALPYRTLLQNRYMVGKVKSCNSEGITYIGYDTILRTPIELREFFPATLCSRVSPVELRANNGSEVTYDECLSSFLSFSREIAHFRQLPAVPQLYDIFEENNTAYTVAERVESITLRYFVERSGGTVAWNAARQLFMPVLSALSTLHSAGINHLGISPETLIIGKDGRMKLSGFSIPAARVAGREIPADLYPGCAAPEQYDGNQSVGEAADVYAFTACLFFALTGILPQAAPKRLEDPRLLLPSTLLRSIPPHVVGAMANGLQVSAQRRTGTFEKLRAELSASPTVTIETASLHAVPPTYPAQSSPQDDKKGSMPPFMWGLISCVCCLIVLAVVGVIWLSASNGTQVVSSEPEDVSSLSSQEESSQLSSVLSEDPNMIDVPNLVGSKYEEVASQIESNENYQILSAANKQFSDTVPEGYIISQTPEAGEGAKMKKGTAIVVVVSQGPAIRALPEVAGLDLVAASTAVTDAGFIPTKIEEYSDTVPKGLVIGYQNVKPGDTMAYGSQVVLIVSKGKELPYMASAGE